MSTHETSTAINHNPGEAVIDPVHRLRTDNRSQRRRYAMCGLIEEQRQGEEFDFTVDPDEVTCPDCVVIDTGATCPARRRWWHRKPRPHVGVWRSVDIGNARYGRCKFCDRSVQQRLSYGGKALGPWIDDVWLPCDHGRDGVPVPACMSCSNARSKRGLYR